MRRVREKEKPKRPALKAFAEIAATSDGFRPAREVLRRIRAVPTIFPQVDHATRVGGWPIDRVTVVHGPSSHGKTIFSHGLGKSFLDRNHFYALIDAEMTTPITWLETLMQEYVSDPRFVALRPKSYEQAVDEVRGLCERIADAREHKKIPEETSALIVVDSVRKLVPEGIAKRIAKLGAEGDKGSVDGYGGRAAQLRAAMNAAWMDELVPLMHHTGCSICFIARESEDPNADANDRRYGKDWKMGGGKALEFDSSLTARINLVGKVRTGSGEDTMMVGERHRVEFRKTKLSAKTDRTSRAFFHTSNGQLVPEGFDHARDILELAERLGVIERTGMRSGRGGAWMKFGEHKWNGENQAVKALHGDPGIIRELDAEVRRLFESVSPIEAGPEEDGDS